MKFNYLFRLTYPSGNLGMISSFAETKKEAWEQAKELIEELWLDDVEIWDAPKLILVMKVKR